MPDLHPDLARILIPVEEIQARVSELARKISADYENVDQLYLIGVLKGAFIFLADLTRQLNVPHLVDFMALSSYGKTTVSGAVRIVMDLREPIEGQHVLIVEDIVDSGQTLSYLYRILKGRNPASLIKFSKYFLFKSNITSFDKSYSMASSDNDYTHRNH
ncbi:MAG: phosphoribosyltransferase family protein [Anaerolineales bacterium]